MNSTIYDNEVHDKMVEFWKMHSKDANENEMLLDSQGPLISQVEMPELISLFPDVRDKCVLELAAGIGRYVPYFADRAKKVVVTDFMESFVKRNQEINCKFSNVQIYQADATKMKCEDNSYDVVFWTWLTIYMNDMELDEFFRKLIRWLRPGGHLFFRESCFHACGDALSNSNPAIYRTPLQLITALSALRHCDQEKEYQFEIILSKSIQAYIDLKSTANQICFLLRKVEVCSENAMKQSELKPHILGISYEKLDFECFQRIQTFFANIDLKFYQDIFPSYEIKKGAKVLEIGCSTGESAFLISKQFEVDVVGWDENATLICHAQQKLNKSKVQGLQFVTQKFENFKIYNNAIFDLIICRCLPSEYKLQESVFIKLLDSLKSDGKLIVNLLTGSYFDEESIIAQPQQQRVLSSMRVNVNVNETLNKQILEQLELSAESLQRTHDFDELTKQEIDQSLNRKIDCIIKGEMKYGCYIITK